MRLALSTHWNANRHGAGESMLEEILELGIDRVELGYDLTLDLVPGVRRLVEEGAVKVDSVHGLCPLPVGVPYGHPEIFLLGSTDERNRESATTHTVRTAVFAAELGARAVVVHAGRVNVRRRTSKLLELRQAGERKLERSEKLRMKLLMEREKKARKPLDALRRSLETVLPAFEEHGVRLALENLPSWEAIPTEREMVELIGTFGPKALGYWHDTGHGQIRENLGFISQSLWLEKLQTCLVGMHLHDVAPPANDHLMPPAGMVDFARYSRFVSDETILVLEPMPGLPVEEVKQGLAMLRAALSGAAENGGAGDTHGPSQKEEAAGEGPRSEKAS